MKNMLLIISALMSVLVAGAQEKNTGTVIYEQVSKMEFKLEGEAAQFANMMPKERKSKKVLVFSPDAALYENSKSETEEDMSMQSDGGNVMIRMTEPENKVYTDIKSKKQIEQQEFMTRIFLIEGAMACQWKLTGNQKMILDFPCQEAVLVDANKKVVAWFTPAIPVSAGPSNYGGLPGLILAVDSEEGKLTISASSVDFSALADNVLVEPKKGKKTTREEFNKINEEKMKEMGAEHGKDGHQMMIRIQR